MKVCIVCKKERPFEHFYRDTTTADGLRGRCKFCKYGFGTGTNEPKHPDTVPANLVRNTMMTAPYKQEHLFAVRPGALDHTRIGSLRTGGVVQQYEDVNGLPKLRSIEVEND